MSNELRAPADPENELVSVSGTAPGIAFAKKANAGKYKRSNSIGVSRTQSQLEISSDQVIPVFSVKVLLEP